MRLASAGLALLGWLAVGPCQAGPSTDAPKPTPGKERQPEFDEGEGAIELADTSAEPGAAGHLSESEHPGSRRCTVAGSPCPSQQLLRVSSELGGDGWRRLRALAERGRGMVALAVSNDRVEIIEGCQLPGRYHEAVAAPDSPGRAWGADRLSFTPGEPRGCERATHVVASFAIRDELDGEAIVLPLPCPPLGRGKPPVGCIGAGLDDAARKAAARERWELGRSATVEMKHEELASTLPGMLELAALMPEAAAYVALAKHLSYLDSERYGGCLWYADAARSAHLLDPEFVPSESLVRQRPALSHEIEECHARPSLLTCFPQRYTPGYGGNCW